MRVPAGTGLCPWRLTDMRLDRQRAGFPVLTAGGLYPLAWLPYAALYFGALMTFGLPPGLAARNAAAGVLPAALLGLLVLRVPRRLPWPEAGRARFFATQAALLLAFLAAPCLVAPHRAGADDAAPAEPRSPAALVGR